jgi:hypothetical protein
MGRANVVIFYRKNVDPSMGSLEALTFHMFQRTNQTAQEACDIAVKPMSHGSEVIAVSHTARGSGVDIQTIWYIPSSLSTAYSFHVFESNKSMDDLREKADKYLNTYINPNQIVGLSFQEEDHPNTILNEFLGVLMYTGTVGEPVVRPETVKGTIFQQKFIDSFSGWEELYASVQDFVGGLNDTHHFIISTSNQSPSLAEYAAVVTYWSNAHHDCMEDVSRGGCCTIF